METLWRLEGLTAEAITNPVKLRAGLKLHVQHDALTSILVRIGTQERTYIALSGCAGCSQGRCEVGCCADLFARLLRACAPGVEMLPVAHGLSRRPYRRGCLAWPRVGAIFPPEVDDEWVDVRMTLAYAPDPSMRVSAHVLTDGEGPEPATILRRQGWRAVPLPQAFIPRWRHIAGVLPGVRPAKPLEPALLVPNARASLSLHDLAGTTTFDDEAAGETPACVWPSAEAVDQQPSSVAELRSRLADDVYAVLAGETRFYRGTGGGEPRQPEPPAPPDEPASRFPSGPGVGRGHMAPADVEAWLRALLSSPDTISRKSITLALAEQHKEHGAVLLRWLDAAGVLSEPADAAEPYRHPRHLLVTDADMLADRLRMTAVPDRSDA